MIFKLEKERELFFQNVFNFLSIAFLILIFLYISIRAYTLSLTHDEAYTYLYCINPRNIFDFYVPNNHLLHTFLVKISISMFGNSELVIRIPNLIGTGLYLYGVYKLSKYFFTKTLYFLISTLILGMNPVIIDFLPLSRGYALALGFMILGIYYLFQSLENEKPKRPRMILTCSLLLAISVTAILTFIYVFISALFLIFLREFHKLNWKEKTKKNINLLKKTYLLIKNLRDPFIKPIIPGIFIVALTFGFFGLPLLYFSGGLYWGVKDFYRTILSLIKHELQEYDYTKFNYFIITPLSIFVQIMLIISLLIFFYNFILIFKDYRTKKSISNKEGKYILISATLLFTTIGLLYLQYLLQLAINMIIWNRLLGNFPVDRTGIYLMPLYLLFLLTTWFYNIKLLLMKRKEKEKSDNSELTNHKIKKSNIKKIIINKTLIQSFFAIFIIFLLFFNFYNLNLTHTYCSKGNASVKYIAQDLRDLNPNGDHKDVYVQTLVEIPLLYYKERYQLDWMETFHYFDANYDFDYYIIQTFEKDLIEQYNLQIIKYYPLSDIYLCI